MRFIRSAALVLALLALGFSLVAAQEGTPEPVAKEPATEETTPSIPTGAEYTVRAGDTLFRIALRFNTSVSALANANGIANPALIYAGQRLIIPGTSSPEPTATPEAPASPETPASPEAPETTQEYVVQRGDTLYRIAVRFGTTIGALARLNNLSNTNLIIPGQRLLIPGAGESVATPAPTTAPVVVQATPTPTPAAPIPGVTFETGIEVFLQGQAPAAIVSQAAQLNLGWIKLTVDWRDLEMVQGSIDFDALDAFIDALADGGFKVMLTVTGAPDWARPSATQFVLSSVEYGPPDDPATYGAFVGALAARYAGKVQAYEIWQEPNLRRSWIDGSTTERANARISNLPYIELLQAAYTGIKEADPQAAVITAALAPTGLNDRRNAIDDRVFLTELLRQGAANFSDGVGVQPSGFANPPDTRAPQQAPGVDTHFDNPRFFFLDTLEEYRAILQQAGQGNRALWVTRFGWGTAEGNALTQPDENSAFLRYTTPSEQAIYLTRAFALGQELGYVGPMMLYNLNGCQVNNGEACYYSVIDSTNAARPAFAALQSALNPDSIETPPVDAPVEATEEAQAPTEAEATAEASGG